MSRFRSEISVKGPFFRADPEATLQENIGEMMRAAADEGAKDVIGRLRSATRDPIRELGDRVADHIIGMSPDKLVAVVFVGNRAYSASQATSLMAAASERETRDHPFRQTTGRLRSANAVNRAELTKGLN